MTLKRIFVLITAALALAATAPHASAAPYSFVDLGTLGGSSSEAMDVNSAGQIVGWSTTADGSTHAALWSNGKIYDLGTLGGTNSQALGINALGQIVGYSDIAGNSTQHATLWNSAGISDLGALAGNTRSQANDINNAGQIVGFSSNGNIVHHATLWSGGTAVALGSSGAAGSEAYAINSSGQIAGGQYNLNYWGTDYDYNSWQATVWNGGTPTVLGAGHAYDINDAGQAVGDGATLWNGASAVKLQYPVAQGCFSQYFCVSNTTRAYAINNLGEAAGTNASEYAHTALYWEDPTHHMELTTDGTSPYSGKVIYSLNAISDSKLIVGKVWAGSGYHAFVITVPEPETYALMLAGLGLIGAAARRRQRA